MSVAKLQDDHHVLRSVSSSRIHWNEERTVVLGIFPHALHRRQGEAYLSVTWVEYFPGNQEHQIKSAATVTKDPGKNGGFALAQVGTIHEVCREQRRSVRILHEKDPDNPNNPAHAAVRQYPENDDPLIDLLCEKAFSNLIMKRELMG